MFVLIPLPGNVAKMLQSTQREAMKKVGLHIPSCRNHIDDTIDGCPGTDNHRKYDFFLKYVSRCDYDAHVLFPSLERSPNDQTLWVGG